MIAFSAFLVVVAVGLLVAGVVTSKLLLVYVAIGVSGVSLLALGLGALIKRKELFGAKPETASIPVPPPPVPVHAPAAPPDPQGFPQSAAAPAGYAWSAVAQPAQPGQPGPPRAGYLPSDQPPRIPPAPEPLPAAFMPRPAPGDPAPAPGTWEWRDTPPVSPPPSPIPAAPPAFAPYTPPADFAPTPFAPAEPTTVVDHPEPTPAVQDLLTSTDDQPVEVQIPPLPDEHPASWGEGPSDEAPWDTALADQPQATIEQEPERLTQAPDEPAAAGTVSDFQPPDLQPPAGPDAAPAPLEVDLQRQVTVVPGVPRYHNANCILIRFMGEEDLNKMPLGEARQAGCTPCRACQPDQPEATLA